MTDHPIQDRARRAGILYPQRLPKFHRLAPSADVAHAVSWFWIPEWHLPAGETSLQHVLPFPACNIVVDPSGIIAVGPPTRRSARELTGQGWAVGALLRPVAAHAIITDLAPLLDSARPLDDPALHRAVVTVMNDPEQPGEHRREAAAAALAAWILHRVPAPPPGSEGALANELQVALADPSLTQVAGLAPRLHASTRTLQRVAARYFGLSLHAMIRRRRLQEAADRLRTDPDLTIAHLAGELGYADHAHFTSDFRRLLGVTPSDYRASAANTPSTQSR